ncbi:MAG: glycosyltransferase [Propionibacteriaceae bacterium]
MTESSAPLPVVSVCMATWNGAAWVEEQLQSILDQLAPTDEIVVVDDASSDDTCDVVAAVGDPRIRLVTRSDNWGYVRTFEQALGLARGEYLLLADQDDVWLPGRVEAMVAALADADVVASNLTTLGGPVGIQGPYGQQDWRLRARDSHHRLRNVVGILAGAMPYYGCAMGVRRSALTRVLPFPTFLFESHDLWIALYGNVLGRMTHLGRRTVARRLHETNQTPDRPRGLPAVLRSRVLLLRCIADLQRRGALDG